MIEWIISSSVLILVILGLRAIFRGKINPILQYLLWGIVLIRLLIPISFGTTSISAVKLKDTLEQQPSVHAVIDAGNIPIATQSYEDAYQHVVNQYESQGIFVEHLDYEAQNAMQEEIQDLVNGPTFWDIAKSIMLWGWLIGIVFVCILFLYTNIRFYISIACQSATTGIVKEKLPVRVVGNLDTPCLFGLLHPVIYITEDALEDETYLLHIVEHEYTHYLHKDHIWSVLRGVCVALHWYNPLVWVAAFLSQRDGEIACDEATIKRLGEQERASYGRTLIRMTCRKKTNVLATATTMNASKRGIKERIQSIAKKPKMAVYTCAAILVIVAVAVVCAFSGADKKVEEDPIQPGDQQLIQFFDTYTGEERPAYGTVEVNYIGSVEDYALVLYTGTYTELVLYRYESKGDEIRVLDSMTGAYKMSKGMTVNHLKVGSGHLYFGTVVDSRGTWKELVMIDDNGKETICDLQGKNGYLCVLETPVSYFRVMTETDYTATDMAEYLSRNKIVEVEKTPERLPTVPTVVTKPTETTEPPETTKPEETVRTWPYADPSEFENKYPDVFTVEGSDIGPLYKDKVHGLISLGLHTTLSGEVYVFVIPENQEEIIAAFKKAYAEITSENVSSGFMSGFTIEFQSDSWLLLTDGSLYRPNYQGGGDTIPAEASAEMLALCEAAIRNVGVPEPVKPDDITQIKTATLNWNGTHTVTDTESLQLIESLLSNSVDLGYGAGCPFGALLTLELENGKTVTVTIATDSCGCWMSEGKFYTFYAPGDSNNDGNRTFYKVFAMGLLHYASSGHMDNLPYLIEYLDWDRYAQTYGDQEARYLINQLKAWILDSYEDRLFYALWRLPDLNGACSEIYADMLTQLYDENPTFFAKICLENLYDVYQKNAFSFLGQHWNMSINEVQGKLREAVSNP